MYPVHRILVAVKDPSARSLPAVTKAAQLARALDAEVRLFHAIAEPLYVDALGIDARALRELQEKPLAAHRKRLESIAGRLRKSGVRASTAVEWDFPIHEAIVRSAAHFEADLIVAECHPGAHRAPWLLRFTDWELLRTSPLPVLLVKSRRPYHRPRVLAAVDPSHAYAKPLDLDDEIVRYGSTLADALRGQLHAVHAYDPLPIGVSPAQLAAPNMAAQLEAQAAGRARTALQRALGSAVLPSGRRHLLGRHPIDAIEEVVEETGCGIVVMGAISRSGLKRLFIGNTAEKLLDSLPCDVLVVKPRQFRNRIARAPRGPQVVALPLVAGF